MKTAKEEPAKSEKRKESESHCEADIVPAKCPKGEGEIKGET